jgi:hypothetical protein
VSKTGTYPSEHLSVALSLNIRPSWKGFARDKGSNLFVVVVIDEEKKFYNIVTSGLYYKYF